jgi:predicted RNA-binding protein
MRNALLVILALAVGLAVASVFVSSRLDRYHRDQLYAVLAFYKDTTYAAVAQTQLLGADGQVDRGALRYLEQSLGAQAVPLAVQNYHDPRLTNSAAKEPFARVALAYVGADAQANQFYTEAINDAMLTPNHRKNLIEDLNQDGFADPGNLTTADLPLIENRIRLIEEQAPGAMDQANAAAFQEAYKDLLNMRAKITGPPPGQP